MCHIIKLVYPRERLIFIFHFWAERRDDSSTHPSTRVAAVTLVSCLVCTELWHHSPCETNTPIPLGLSWRSCRVTTFPLPLWASPCSREPNGQRGSSAWELEPGQTYSPMNSQQEGTLIKHHHRTQKNADGDLRWAFLASKQSRVGAKTLNVGTLSVWLHLCGYAPCSEAWCVTASDARCDGVTCRCNGSQEWAVLSFTHTRFK